MSWHMAAAEPSHQVLKRLNSELSLGIINKNKVIDIDSWSAAKHQISNCLIFSSIKNCDYRLLEQYLSNTSFKQLEVHIDQVCERGVERVNNINYLVFLKSKKITPNCLQLVQNRLEIIKYQEFIK